MVKEDKEILKKVEFEQWSEMVRSVEFIPKKEQKIVSNCHSFQELAQYKLPVVSFLLGIGFENLPGLYYFSEEFDELYRSGDQFIRNHRKHWHKQLGINFKKYLPQPVQKSMESLLFIKSYFQDKACQVALENSFSIKNIQAQFEKNNEEECEYELRGKDAFVEKNY